MKWFFQPFGNNLEYVGEGYVVVTGGKFDTLLKCTEDKMPNEVWEEVKFELTEVAKNIIGIKPEQRWVKQDSKEAFLHVGNSRELQMRTSFAEFMRMKPVEDGLCKGEGRLEQDSWGEETRLYFKLLLSYLYNAIKLRSNCIFIATDKIKKKWKANVTNCALSKTSLIFPWA